MPSQDTSSALGKTRQACPPGQAMDRTQAPARLEQGSPGGYLGQTHRRGAREAGGQCTAIPLPSRTVREIAIPGAGPAGS